MKVKYLAATAIVIILIGLPIGSYLYLRSGFLYRVEVLHELESKGESSNSMDCDALASSGEIDLDPKTLLLAQFSNPVHEQELKTKLRLLNDQFSDSETFQMVWLMDSGSVPDLDADENILLCEMDASQLNFVFEDHELVLVDTSMQIRNRYLYSVEKFKRVVEHLAIILPREKKKNIVLQRESER